MAQGLALAVSGAAAGILGGTRGDSILEELMVRVPATDGLTFVLASGLLVGVALAACWVPARRAARVDPMVALHCE